MFKVDKTFIDICNENIEIISKAYKDPKPIKLIPYPMFKEYEEIWWLQFDQYRHKKESDNDKGNIGFTKQVIKDHKKDIPIIKALQKHLFEKIFSIHKVVSWISLEDFDYGTPYHQDFLPGSNKTIPMYLIGMNLVGNTEWQYKEYDSIYLSAGDSITINGGVFHQVQPKGPRITIAGYSSIKDIIL